MFLPQIAFLPLEIQNRAKPTARERRFRGKSACALKIRNTTEPFFCSGFVTLKFVRFRPLRSKYCQYFGSL